jgi:hypothetical protein
MNYGFVLFLCFMECWSVTAQSNCEIYNPNDNRLTSMKNYMHEIKQIKIDSEGNLHNIIDMKFTYQKNNNNH